HLKHVTRINASQPHHSSGLQSACVRRVGVQLLRLGEQASLTCNKEDRRCEQKQADEHDDSNFQLRPTDIFTLRHGASIRSFASKGGFATSPSAPVAQAKNFSK